MIVFDHLPCKGLEVNVFSFTYLFIESNFCRAMHGDSKIGFDVFLRLIDLFFIYFICLIGYLFIYLYVIFFYLFIYIFIYLFTVFIYSFIFIRIQSQMVIICLAHEEEKKHMRVALTSVHFALPEKKDPLIQFNDSSTLAK